MRAYVTNRVPLPLPSGHPFPMVKYDLLVDGVRAAGAAELCDPEPATPAELSLAHDPAYVERVRHGTLEALALRRIGFPWCPELYLRACDTVGATICATRAAVEEGVGVSLGGGLHHARRDAGAGYCVFNDIVVASRVAQQEGLVRRVLVVDTDMHQGDGTASITADDPSIFTFSIHSATAFPLRKEASSLDLALADRTGDEPYLAALAGGLARALEAARADLVVHVAGVDPYVGDQTSRLSLTRDGLRRRDRMVLEACRGLGLPVVVTMSGGYSRRPEEVAALHLQTVAVAAAFDGR